MFFEKNLLKYFVAPNSLSAGYSPRMPEYQTCIDNDAAGEPPPSNRNATTMLNDTTSRRG